MKESIFCAGCFRHLFSKLSKKKEKLTRGLREVGRSSKLCTRSLSSKIKAATVTSLIVSKPRPMSCNLDPLAALRTANGV